MSCCSDYNAGMLQTTVSFQRKTQVADGAGGWTETWAAISNTPTRAFVKAMSGNERFLSMRVDAIAKWKVVTRYFAGLVEGDRILIEGRTANIRFINNVEYKNRWLEIEVDFGVAT
jgi:SPP1 family predicted phage head-tail adaptor